jgi:hypothetical protein
MGSLSTVFQAEVMPVLRCTELPLTKNVTRTRIHVCSDKWAEIAALAKTITELAFDVSMQALEELSGSELLYYGYPGIVEYRKMKKLINWPRKGLMGFLQTNCWHPCCCGQRSHQESFETGG